MYDGAVMITASHLPSHRNGFKFFTKAGGLSKQDIAQVRHVNTGWSFLDDSQDEGHTVSFRTFIDLIPPWSRIS